MEPFRADILSHAPVTSAAYPPSRDIVYFPTALAYQYDSQEADPAVLHAAAQSTAHLTKVALSLGQDIREAAPYGNYALAAITTSQDLYRSKLLDLGLLRAKYDPMNVMSLTGGWKI